MCLFLYEVVSKTQFEMGKTADIWATTVKWSWAEFDGGMWIE